MKIKKCDKLKLIRLIKSMEGKTNRQIRDKIKEIFNVTYNVSNIRHLKDLAYKEEWLAKLKRDDEIIKAWYNKDDLTKDDTKDKIYAEKLFKLFSGEISNDEFLKEGLI